MLQYPLFYRKNTVRALRMLIEPVMQDTVNFELPLASIYHYCDYDGINNGPLNNDLMFKNNTKPIQVMHVTELGNKTISFPTKIAINNNSEIKDYHTLNKRTKLLRNLDTSIRDNHSLIVYNYSLLLKNYRYVRSYFTEYHKWYNIFSTTCSTINSISQQYDRNHYITVNIPKIIPSYQQLILASNKALDQTLLKTFKDSDSFILLELFKYIDTDPLIREGSLFSLIDKTKIHLVNLIYLEGSKWVNLNLGALVSFLIDSKKDDLLVIKSKEMVTNSQLQKRLIRLTMSIMEVRTLAIAQSNDIDLEQIKLDDNKAQDDLDKLIDGSDAISNVSIINTPTELQDNESLDVEDEDTLKQRLKQEDDLLDEQLASLNEIAKKQDNDENVPTTSLKQLLTSSELPDLSQGVLDVCNALADDGLLSAGELKRFQSISLAYKQLKTPDGQFVHEYINIDPKELVITQKPVIPNKSTILDKSMLNASLSEFDPKYIKQILPKDIYSMVLNVQRAGVAVTDYKIEPVTDILGGYETHVVKLQPVVGKSSIVRFKLPQIDESGVYKSGNVKYRLRKQRGDLPIRKIDSNAVALTSYYGKTFINRGRRKSDDYGYWLISEIMASSFDKGNSLITNILNADVFDQTSNTPRAYSAISEQIKSLACRDYTLNFDYKIREKLYGSENIRMLEKQNSVVFGINKENHLLVLDTNNTVYVYKNIELEVFGSIEHFLNINLIDAPVEYSEVSVFGKDVSVGLVLAYFIGFEKLLKLLKVNPRRVPAHTRLNLAPHEWILQFSDETLVFNREDKLASIILGGFNSYHKAIRSFSVYSFDKKGVYLNLLEANGLSTRYIREIDLMNKMFVDPITRDILLQMKEPTTFQGLLIRSCELLLTDQHPDALDPRYMRIKGYERISGAVYTELVQSIRYHEGRLGKANAQIELNPYAVWKRISEDPSKSQVNEINPIESLKETEAITFSGTGGRNRRSMTKTTRGYHESDMGTVSESTVDSSDVAINVFSSASPLLNSLRGTSDRYVIGKTGATSLLSTSALLSPGSVQDDCLV